MKKWIMLTAATLLAVTLLTACGTGKTAETAEAPAGKVKVAVTFDAMREFVQAVGKDKVEIVNMIPDGTEPHEFEPTTKTLKELGSARLLVYNGPGDGAMGRKSAADRREQKPDSHRSIPGNYTNYADRRKRNQRTRAL
jgi:ABC-type Zn uptake system ZnuABC Zn-binding protein ZnuA